MNDDDFCGACDYMCANNTSDGANPVPEVLLLRRVAKDASTRLRGALSRERNASAYATELDTRMQKLREVKNTLAVQVTDLKEALKYHAAVEKAASNELVQAREVIREYALREKNSTARSVELESALQGAQNECALLRKQVKDARKVESELRFDNNALFGQVSMASHRLKAAREANEVLKSDLRVAHDREELLRNDPSNSASLLLQQQAINEVLVQELNKRDAELYRVKEHLLRNELMEHNELTEQFRTKHPGLRQGAFPVGQKVSFTHNAGTGKVVSEPVVAVEDNHTKCVTMYALSELSPVNEEPSNGHSSSI